jgi:hypothetical protein
MTDKELKDLVVSLAIESKKTSEQMRKTNEQIQNLKNEQSKLNKKWDSFLGNYGEVAEEYFYRSLEKNKTLGKLKFNDIERNIRKTGKSVEFDIILINGNSIAIIEVKNKARPKDIKPMVEKKIKHFKIDYPEYADYIYYFGIASMITNDEMISQAKNEGIFLLTQNSDHLEVIYDGINSF